MNDAVAGPGLEHVLKTDAAYTLGRAGKRLQVTLAALRAFDAQPDAAKDRTQLVDAAAHALWCYVVQREMLHLPDRKVINQTFEVPLEVWNAMGRRR
ncbi:MAG TPA: DUF6665 family protein [Nevskiaceae bacterium]|nr:DUF6665 family protein [Nevskiaceae bacterium]